MSHSPPNYMDGVPVKISERFKPPPKIVLPQGVVNRLNQYDVGQVMHDSCYDGELEDTVLKRITEWKAVKERDRYERKARLQAKEHERMRVIEQEQKRKLNQISYPNTDELSSASDDNDPDGEGHTTARTINGSEDDYEEENDESAPSGSSDERTNAKPFDHMSQLSSILVPTVIRDTVPSAVDAPAAYPNVLVKATIIPKTTQSDMAMPPNATFGSNNNNNNNNYNKINYSDFENDTSSPFDNMELRTINDLAILAQVLKQNTTLTSPVNEVEKPEPHESIETKEQTQPVSVPTAVHSSEPRQLQEQPQLQALHNPSPITTNPYSSTAYGANQQYSMYPAQYQQPTQTTIASSGVNEYLPSPYNAYQPYNNYGTQYETTSLAASCYSPANTLDSRYSLTNYASSTYHVPPVTQNQRSSYSPVVTNYAYGYQQQQSYVTAPSTSMASGTGTSTYAPNYGYNSNSITAHKDAGGYYSNYQPVSASSDVAAYPSIYTTATGTPGVGTADTQTGLRSKSRSVPDIMRQLDDEVQDSATRRTRNNSQTIADRQAESGQYAVSNNTAERSTVDYTIYNQLTQTDQNIVKRISSMGFPLERVVWVLKRIGNDDKKIIEHLIPLSELLDLGFEGEKISDALLKFGNNKHKALDYLIS
ncbi:probable serine/threonine-protein kinase nek3 [Anopheles moucheti]|uniref:probable serine/threonine-protein kinase nek3 n=1 Tax=Anopheles moucheti TaxID=186751 RepID=UPI0022F025A3|nr:probable serine/threonine-protein kinase nek3 [Anopheles moucheti]